MCIYCSDTFIKAIGRGSLRLDVWENGLGDRHYILRNLNTGKCLVSVNVNDPSKVTTNILGEVVEVRKAFGNELPRKNA